MLTDAERERIRLEETYRAEVRESVNGRAKGGNKIWSFLNSAFGLWLLSTVAVGLITSSYQTRQARSVATQAAERTRIALTAEIDYRLQPVDRMQEFSTILAYLGKLEAGDISRSALGEYKSRTIGSLFWELETLDLGDSRMRRGEIFRYFQEIQKVPPAAHVNHENLDRFKVFCYHWAKYSGRSFEGALRRPPGLVNENGQERPLTQEDLSRPLR